MSSPEFVPWSSQPFDEWCKKYAPGSFVDLGGNQAHYVDKGEGDPLILLHGFGSDSNSWHANIGPLSSRFRVLALDLYGCGYSTRKPVDYGYDLYARQLLAFMDALELDRASLVGQSMGGGTIIKFATQHPERVKSLVLVCSGGMPRPPVLAQRLFSLPGLGEFALRLPTDQVRKWVIKSVYLYRKPVTKKYFDLLTWSQKIEGSNESYLSIIRRNFFHTLSEEIHRLAQFNIPILIVWGRHDKGIPLKLGEEMHRILQGSRLEVFEESGHEPHDEEPDKFNELVSGFLRDQ